MQLFGFELRWAETIGHALIPKETLRGIAGRVDWPAEINHQAAMMPLQSRLLIHLGLALVWFAPLFMGHFRVFGSLAPEAREGLLEKLFKARLYLIRQILIFIKMTLCSCALGNEQVMRELKAYDFGQPIRLTIGARS